MFPEECGHQTFFYRVLFRVFMVLVLKNFRVFLHGFSEGRKTSGFFSWFFQKKKQHFLGRFLVDLGSKHPRKPFEIHCFNSSNTKNPPVAHIILESIIIFSLLGLKYKNEKTEQNRNFFFTWFFFMVFFMVFYMVFTLKSKIPKKRSAPDATS